MDVPKDDNCPCHMSQIQNLAIVTASPNMESPDFECHRKCVENDQKQANLPREQHRIKTRQKLVEAVMRIWTSITPGYIQCLYKTLPDRLCAVLKAKGHATKKKK
jgi:hypothetical protein